MRDAPEKIKPTNAFYVVAYWLIKIYLFIVHPVKVEGLQNLPWHNVLLCPNHSSDWDPLIIAVHLPVNYRLHAMAKAELFENPILGWILRTLGVFPVRRGGADINAVKTAIQILRDGDNLMIFPEGTTIRNGVGYMDGLPPKAKSGAVMIGSRTDATLIPVFVDGPKKPFRRTRLIFGKPYPFKPAGRRATAEETQLAADEMLAQAYALGGQAVGGLPLNP
ncbi:MAG: 1-acyl-sn-glycerol-3-phosphate acyltransferase [Oscillibacter sp.]|nr:1-acyl-sn-glycerol-3-phosphate acyltransferase [Oscillibacter sp.]